MTDEWISGTEAGKRMGVTRQRVYQIVHGGQWTAYPIRARRNGHQWEYHAGDCNSRKVALDAVKRMLYRTSTPQHGDVP